VAIHGEPVSDQAARKSTYSVCCSSALPALAIYPGIKIIHGMKDGALMPCGA
jgi:hypothetical protein